MRKFLLSLFSISFIALSANAQTYKIAVDAAYPPFSFKQGDTFVGIELDMLAEIAKREGFSYELKFMNFDGVIPGLVSGQIDGALDGINISDERKKIVKALKKEATVVECNQVSNMNQFIQELFKNYRISQEDINLFQKRVGNHLELLEQEAEKLKIAAIEDKMITTELIDDLTVQTIDLDIFSLIEAIVNKQKEKAMTMLDEMIKRGEEPIMILIMLANQFRIIYQAKELYQKGYTEKNIASMLNIHPFRIKKALEKGRMFPSDILLTYLKQLAELDYQIKNGEMNKRLGLELFLLGL